VVTSGTSATIVATYNGAMVECTVHVYTLTGYNSATPTAINSNAVTSGDPSTTINITGSGSAVGLWVGSLVTSASPSWTGLDSVDDDSSVTGITNCKVSAAHSNGLATETPRTISVSSTMTNETLIAASWH
jgi:hypothetical protein